MENPWIFAQTGTSEAPAHIGSEPMDAAGQATTKADGSPNKAADGTAPSKSPSSLLTSLLPLILIFVVMYFLLMRGPRKQEQQRRQMVQSLKKNDKVRTIGGIYGTVMDVKGDEVILKIDEATNTKIHISTSAIGKNLSQEGKE